MKDEKKKVSRMQSLGEEIANAVSHGIGTALSVAAMVVLIVQAVANGLGAIAVVSAALYGAGLILLYTNSSLYHSLTNRKAKRVFRIFDHCSIFILILSTYIPIFLVILGGALGWTCFGICTFCTILGIVLNSINLERWAKLSMILYIALGWLVVLVIKPVLEAMDFTEILLLVLGGLSYTLGIFFYKNRRKYMHFIWHLFVLGGSVLHYFSILHYYMK